jgi:hypothetical protein
MDKKIEPAKVGVFGEKLAIGYWLLAVGCWLLAVGCWV